MGLFSQVGVVKGEPSPAPIEAHKAILRTPAPVSHRIATCLLSVSVATFHRCGYSCAFL